MDWMKNIKVIISDLDGTLYQDYTFLGRYINYLLDGIIDEQEIQGLINESYEILTGKHPIKLGHYYNRQNNRVYTLEELQLMGGIDETHLYLGDPWCIAALYTERYNIGEGTRIYAFERVRKEMINEPYKFPIHNPLFERIGALKLERKIFMTNTAGQSGPEFVKHLAIGQLFDEFIYDAKKPFGIQLVLNRLFSEGYHPFEILSIGDNPFNDLVPVKQAGGKTCLISQYPHEDAIDWDVSVKTIEELAAFLHEFEVIHQ